MDGQVEANAARFDRVFEQLGKILVRLHTRVKEVLPYEQMEA